MDPIIDAQREIRTAIETHPELPELVTDVQAVFELIPPAMRKGALLFLISSLVARFADNPRHAVAELNAHALDAVCHALSTG